MNKSIKIWLNYLLGLVISALLIWGIYIQVQKQVSKLSPDALWHTGPDYFLWACLLLMPVNLALEARRWQILAGSAQPLSYRQASASYFAGIALSVVTPNRIGEYPGRILYLKRKNTFRLISVSILGIAAQLLAIFIFGILGSVYYNISFPGPASSAILASCLVGTTVMAVLYWRFEKWLPLLQKFKWLRRFNIYGQLLKRFTTKEQLAILIVSLIRYSIYTTQYLFLLKWMNVEIPMFEGFLMASLFFWIIAVIPSVTIFELGERGQVGLFLFQHFSGNAVGILGATVGVWCVNLVLPAIVGSILLFRMRWLR